MSSTDERTIDPHAPGSSLPGAASESTPDACGYPPEFRRAFSLLAFEMGRFMVDHVVRSARQFDNDIESMMLFGMLSHLNIVHLALPGSDPGTTLDHEGRSPGSQPKLRPVRVRDLAQIMGRPRETVRRKLEHLRSMGRVQRVEGGWVMVVTAVDAQMQALTIDGFMRFLRTAEAMKSILASAAASIARESGAAAEPSASGAGP